MAHDETNFERSYIVYIENIMFSIDEKIFFFGFWNCIACSRLSDSGEDAKEKGTRKVVGAGKRKKEGRESHYFTTLFHPLLARLR